jgi:hydroxymethylglutaryl-CoA lyase
MFCGTVEESKIRILEIIQKIQQHNKLKLNPIRIRGYISCIAGCPYIGNIDNNVTIDLCKWMLKNGVDEVSLGDTIGAGTPEKINVLLKGLKENNVDFNKFAVHFHDTNGLALENIKIALNYGIRTIDTSVGDIGGCPFAKKNSDKTPIGNVSTIKVVKELEKLGYCTGINLKKLKITDTYARGEFLNNSKLQNCS